MNFLRSWLFLLVLSLSTSLAVNAQKKSKFPLEDFSLFPPVAFLYGYEVKIVNYLILDDLLITNTKTHYIKDKSKEAEDIIERAFKEVIGEADYQEMQFDSLTKTLFKDEAGRLFGYLSINRGLVTEVESLIMNAYFNRSNKKYSVIPFYTSVGTYNKRGVFYHELDYAYILIVENETKAIHHFQKLEFHKQRVNDITHYKKQYALLMEYYRLKQGGSN